MTSKKQILANRANAKRSTGPKTPSGKARSSKNRLAHGLTSQQDLVGDEDPQEYEAFHESIISDLRLEGPLEQSLGRIIAARLWRMQRSPRIEASMIQQEIENEEQRYRKRDGSSAVDGLRAKIEAMASRRSLTKIGEEKEPCAVERAKSQSEVESGDQAGRQMAKPLPRQEQLECQKRALATIMSQSSLSNLGRYEATSLNSLIRCYTLLRLIQATRLEAEGKMKVIAPA